MNTRLSSICGVSPGSSTNELAVAICGPELASGESSWFGGTPTPPMVGEGGGAASLAFEAAHAPTKKVAAASDRTVSRRREIIGSPVHRRIGREASHLATSGRTTLWHLPLRPTARVRPLPCQTVSPNWANAQEPESRARSSSRMSERMSISFSPSSGELRRIRL